MFFTTLMTTMSGVLLRIIRSCLSDHGTLLVLDVDRFPLPKFYTTYLIDRLLNLPARSIIAPGIS